jgi:hypothetical protein
MAMLNGDSLEWSYCRTGLPTGPSTRWPATTVMANPMIIIGMVVSHGCSAPTMSSTSLTRVDENSGSLQRSIPNLQSNDQTCRRGVCRIYSRHMLPRLPLVRAGSTGCPECCASRAAPRRKAGADASVAHAAWGTRPRSMKLRVSLRRAR